MDQSSKNISVSIAAAFDKIYAFASNPENMPKWIAFIKSVEKRDGKWLAKTDLGNIYVVFVAKNDFGVMDHEVTLESGDTFNNPMRVIANGNKSEVVFTLFWAEGRSEAEFNADATAVAEDLATLKELMEA